mgnify:CR=1 FL=1
MQEIPIYLFTGFMDSGKTTLIKETLLENGTVTSDFVPTAGKTAKFYRLA